MAMPDTTSTDRKRGPIIISRHGRPALDRTAGPRLNWKQYRDWWERYEIGPLADDQTPPDGLVKSVADADIAVSYTHLTLPTIYSV